VFAINFSIRDKLPNTKASIRRRSLFFCDDTGALLSSTPLADHV
jgi:hypothetical protein